MGSPSPTIYQEDVISTDRIVGALLGTAVGDALGMPIEGLSHQNVRTYYKGIKAYRADEKRGGLEAGQWTDDTQLTFALARAMTEAADPATWPEQAAAAYVALRPHARRWGATTRAAVDRLASGTPWQEAGDAERPTNGAAMRAAPLGAWWAISNAAKEEAFDLIRPVLEVTHRHVAAVVAGFGQAFAVRRALLTEPGDMDAAAFWAALVEMTDWAERQYDNANRRVSARLRALAGHLDDFPLDLQDLCDGTGLYADEAWPFAAAMFARAPHLLEATLLSTVNVGGDADTTGAMVGALLGAYHGWSSFPAPWREGLEAAGELERQARAFAGRLG